jgi:hypothetical protein
MMHVRKLTSAAALIACGALLAIAASRPQDKPAAKTPPPPAAKAAPSPMEDPAMMEKMMKLATPSDAHKELAKHAGTWEVHYKMRMSPDMPWMETDGTVEKKSILGGRYIQEDVAFSVMGMPMQGMQILGFDNLTQEYISWWADSMSTWWVTARGKKAADGTIELKGTMVDVAGSRPYRMVIRPKGEDTTEVEMYDTIPPKGDVLVMSLTEKRKK